jgi:hypothetical protein
MSAAIYGRKITFQRGDEESKSVARQTPTRKPSKRLGFPPLDGHHIYAMTSCPART